MIANRLGNGNSANRSNTLEARCDVNPIAEEIVFLHDNIPDVDAYAEFDSAILRCIGVSLAHATLQFRGARDRIDHARKFHKHTVAGELDGSALMLAEFGIDKLGSQRVEGGERA